jgi:hypothetical protein
MYLNRHRVHIFSVTAHELHTLAEIPGCGKLRRMRQLTLEELHAELLHVSVEQQPVKPRFHQLLADVRADLKKRKEWETPGWEVDRKKPLSDWWAGYQDLADYIPE